MRASNQIGIIKTNVPFLGDKLAQIIHLNVCVISCGEHVQQIHQDIFFFHPTVALRYLGWNWTICQVSVLCKGGQSGLGSGMGRVWGNVHNLRGQQGVVHRRVSRQTHLAAMGGMGLLRTCIAITHTHTHMSNVTIVFRASRRRARIWCSFDLTFRRRGTSADACVSQNMQSVALCSCEVCVCVCVCVPARACKL